MSSIDIIVNVIQACYTPNMDNKLLHPIQRRILEVAEMRDIERIGPRELARLVGVSHPQLIIHHLEQLQRKELLDKKRHLTKKAGTTFKKEKRFDLIPVPIYGTANCGPAEFFAADNLEGYINISKRVLGNIGGNVKELFAIKAHGTSMNKARISGEHIENGDIILVDKSPHNYISGEYVLSVINDLANIKKLKIDKENILLLSESTREIPPIYIHKDDNYVICGRISGVIKTGAI